MVLAHLHSMPHIPSRTSSLPKVQQLFRLSRSLFRSSRVPTEHQIDEALQLMCKIPLSELGFDEQTSQPLHGRRQRSFFGRGRDSKASIQYLPIYEGKDFDMGMTVMSRLLYGDLHVRAFDVLGKKGSGRTWTVKLRVDAVMNDENCSAYLLPDKGNIHMFRALTHCAVLDVLAPPYSAEEDRLCTYYRHKQPKSELEDDNGFLKKEIVKEMPVIDLEACLAPPGFVVARGSYCGIQPSVNEEN